MSVTSVEIAGLCRRTAEAAAGAVTWLDDNRAEVRQEHGSLLREFRKFGLAADKLAAAAERPMCVGVFGPSQAGKSYLISAFARRGSDPLIADFDGLPGGLDFVREINPEGGAESTGLVTRFTMRRKPTPAGFPVPVRLLSQADIVKVIGNTFFSDCDLSEEVSPTAAEIARLAEEARAAALSAPQPGLAEQDVWDIQEYFERQFKGEQIVRALSSGGYWTALGDLAPRLPLAARAALFAPLWGRVEAFTELYVKLTGALDRLGYPSDAFCPVEALVARAGAGFARRADSVIDVNTLQGLGGADGPTLAVRGAGGATADLPRPVLTALVAELHVTMRDRPWDFLENTDLLDFPGARSRDSIDVRTYLKPAAGRREEARREAGLGGIEGLFLRGKVAYLFDRYNAEQELTSMLLCIAPSNQEVRTVPGMVKDWIDVTHGPDPDTRAGSQTALFFVLTKFDAEFEEKAGESKDSTARWTRRLTVSLVDFFGKAHRWPHEWTPGRPFDNCFWVRNPNFKSKHILDYDEAGREVGIRTSEVKRIGEQRSEYLATELVARHFHDPAVAWDEAFRLNDGGVSYLARSIAPVCNPTIKTRQIATRLDALRRTMRERLQRYYVSDDLGEQRGLRNAAAQEVARNLLRCAAHQRFGGLVKLLQTSDSELADVFFELQTRPMPSDVIDVSTIFADTGLDQGAADQGVVDKADAFAHAAVGHWVGTIRSLANNPRVCRHFQVDEGALSTLVDELIAGTLRLGLRKRVAADIRRVLSPNARVKDSVVKPALLAADRIGSFVFWLGYDDVEPAARPLQRGTGGRRIFQPQANGDHPVLSEQPSSFDHRFYGDWINAYFDFVRLNSESVAGRQIDVAQNDRVGALLASLTAAAPRIGAAA